MFDFMKDMYLEMCGLDLEEVKKERKEKLEIEKADTVIISKKTKKRISLMGIVFLLIHLISLTLTVVADDLGNTIKSVVMIFLTLIAIICLSFKNRLAELLGILLSAIIVILSFVIPKI